MGPSSTRALPGQRRRDVQGLYNNAHNSTIVIDQALWNNIHIEPRSGIEQSKNKSSKLTIYSQSSQKGRPEVCNKRNRPSRRLCYAGMEKTHSGKSTCEEY
jgi:hypothetical protein